MYDIYRLWVVAARWLTHRGPARPGLARFCLSVEQDAKQRLQTASRLEQLRRRGRVLCALAGIKPVPVVHVYKCDDDSCELKGTKGIKDKARFLDFTRYAHTARPQRAAPAWS